MRTRTWHDGQSGSGGSTAEAQAPRRHPVRPTASSGPSGRAGVLATPRLAWWQRGRGAVFALAAAASLALTAPASAIDTGFEYELNPQHSFGKCLDVAGASQANSAAVIQFQCHDGDNQLFRFVRVVGSLYKIRAVHSDKCLDVAGASQANSAAVIQFQCRTGATNQIFQLLDDKNQLGLTSRIAALHSGKCLDIQGGSPANGAHVIQFECHGGPNQRFDITGSAD